MDIRNIRLNCAAAKQIDLVDYLDLLGFEPARIGKMIIGIIHHYAMKRHNLLKLIVNLIAGMITALAEVATWLILHYCITSAALGNFFNH